jgi:hypothetical protein
MKPLDKSPPKQKVEPTNGNERGRFIEHIPDRNLHPLPLLQQALIHEVAETAALLRRLQDAIEGLATIKGLCLHLAQNRLKDFCDMGRFDASGNQVLRGAKNEILDKEQVNLVPVGWKFLRLAQMPLQEKTKAVFARHGRSGEELPKVNRLQLRVHVIEPEKIAFSIPIVGPRPGPYSGWIKPTRQIEFARQCIIDWIQPAELLPALGYGGGICIVLRGAAAICVKRFHD